MMRFNNAMEIFRLLPQTNCGECGYKTCLAFAGGVFTGAVGLSACPYVGAAELERFGGGKSGTNPVEQEFGAVMRKLQDRLLTLDLRERAGTVQAGFVDGAVTIPIFGKPFSIDRHSRVTTDIHVNGWVLGAVLHYLNYCQGVPLSSNWVPLRELPGGRDWYRLFEQQCEGVLKATADRYPGLFADLVEMFQGRQADGRFESDVAVILSPLPLVPVAICYWRAEDGMESSLNLFFDDSGAANLGLEGLYTLGVGIALMLKKLALVHGDGA